MDASRLAADMALGPALLVVGIGALILAIVVIVVAVSAFRLIMRRRRMPVEGASSPLAEQVRQSLDELAQPCGEPAPSDDEDPFTASSKYDR